MGMPLLTASTPVIAVQPLAKARSNSHVDAVVALNTGAGGATTGDGCPPCARVLTSPMSITVSSVATKMYVGAMNATPVARRPLKFTAVSTSNVPRQSGSV